MKRWVAIWLVVAFVMVGAASAEARGRSGHHYRPQHRSYASFGFGRSHYGSSYVGLGYSRRGWSVGLSLWPSYSPYYYSSTYPSVYSYGYTYPAYSSAYSYGYTNPTYATTYPATTATYPTTYTYQPAPAAPAPAPAPPQPQMVQGWYHPTYGFWCQCHGYQKQSLPNHSYRYDTSKDAKP